MVIGNVDAHLKQQKFTGSLDYVLSRMLMALYSDDAVHYNLTKW